MWRSDMPGARVFRMPTMISNASPIAAIWATSQLRAHDQRLCAADQEERKDRDHEALDDGTVLDVGGPAESSGWIGPDAFQRVFVFRLRLRTREGSVLDHAGRVRIDFPKRHAA